jgi:hypothetical protein
VSSQVPFCALQSVPGHAMVSPHCTLAAVPEIPSLGAPGIQRAQRPRCPAWPLRSRLPGLHVARAPPCRRLLGEERQKSLASRALPALLGLRPPSLSRLWAGGTRAWRPGPAGRPRSSRAGGGWPSLVSPVAPRQRAGGQCSPPSCPGPLEVLPLSPHARGVGAERLSPL